MYLRKLEGQDDAGPMHIPAGNIPEDILTAQLACFVLHLLLSDMLCFLDLVAIHMYHLCRCSLYDSIVTVSQCITVAVLGYGCCICLYAKPQKVADMLLL